MKTYQITESDMDSLINFILESYLSNPERNMLSVKCLRILCY